MAAFQNLIVTVWFTIAVLITHGSALEINEVEEDGPSANNLKSGYPWFIKAVVDKNYVENHLDGTGVEWRRSASRSDALAAIPFAQYSKLKKAQHGEDLELYSKYFFGMENGLILESGAFDGVNVSTTYFFEKFAGWSAIHVEADPGNFAKLSVNRLNSVNVHMALCDAPRILHYVDTGITLAHGIAEFMPDKFLKMHHGGLFKNKTRINDLREIPCFPVHYLFRYLKVKEIDIWVLDTEGSELAVLNGVNFDKITIKLIIMECDNHDPKKDNQKQDYLRQRGYQCHHSHVTCFCRLESAAANSAPNARPNPGRRQKQQFTMQQKKLRAKQAGVVAGEGGIAEGR